MEENLRRKLISQLGTLTLDFEDGGVAAAGHLSGDEAARVADALLAAVRKHDGDVPRVTEAQLADLMRGMYADTSFEGETFCGVIDKPESVAGAVFRKFAGSRARQPEEHPFKAGDNTFCRVCGEYRENGIHCDPPPAPAPVGPEPVADPEVDFLHTAVDYLDEQDEIAVARVMAYLTSRYPS